jgi:hypothetical protein
MEAAADDVGGSAHSAAFKEFAGWFVEQGNGPALATQFPGSEISFTKQSTWAF